MPGLSLICSTTIHEPTWRSALAQLDSGFGASPQVIFRDDHVAIAFSGHEAYPWYLHEDDTLVLFLEGVAYDRPVADSYSRLHAIAERFAAREDVRPPVREFVASSDGDFLCVIYAKGSSRLLAFNDQLGRLPAFHHVGANFFALSREVKFLLPWLREVAIDRFALAQYLMLGYTLGGSTLFSSVRRLPAATAVIMDSPAAPRGVRAELQTLLPLDFDEVGQAPTRAQCIETLVDLYAASIDHRVRRCEELGLPIIADVSGGFDTRTVLGGLEHSGADVRYFTHKLVTGDESGIARQLCELYGRPLEVIGASHEIDWAEFERLVFATDGHVNGWTALSSWRDAAAKRELIEHPVATFMGFGGEFIRHPLGRAWGHGSLASMLRANRLGSALAPGAAARLAGLDRASLVDRCEDYFESYPERTMAGRLKRFYSEYYHSLVLAGEDRARRLFWTVQPLWAAGMYRFEMNAMPLAYSDYAFHAEFLRLLDPRLCTVPIYASRIPLASPSGVRLYALRSKLRSQLKVILPAGVRSRISFRRKVGQDYGGVARSFAGRILDAHGGLTFLTDCIALPRIEEFLERGHGIWNLDRLLTVLVYFRQLEERFGDKVVCDDT